MNKENLKLILTKDVRRKICAKTVAINFSGYQKYDGKRFLLRPFSNIAAKNWRGGRLWMMMRLGSSSITQKQNSNVSNRELQSLKDNPLPRGGKGREMKKAIDV
jgi:hypothetical protein